MSNIHEVNVTDENLYLELWQYDAGQKLKFVETSIADGSHVLFANSETRKAIRKEVANNEVGIPNKFLRATGKLHITIETLNENEETTLYEINGYIKRRQDGEPGTSPEDEPTFIQKIIQTLNELKDKVENWFYTKDEVDDKDDFVLGEAKSYADGKAEDLDQAKEDKFTVEGHLSKEDGSLISDSCKVYKYKYTFNKSAYPGIKEGDLIYNYTNNNALFKSDLYYIEDASGPVLQYREINGDAIRVFESVDDPPTESSNGYNPGDIWQKYSNPTFIIRNLTDVFLCVAQAGGMMPATVKWVRLVEDSYSKDEIDDILLDFGNNISCSIDPLTYVCTFQLKNGDSVVSSASIDLPLETMVLDVDYDSQTKELVITLKNGTVRRVDVSAIVSGLVTVSDFEDAISDIEDALDEKEDKISASHKVNVDFLDDSSSSKKLVPTSSPSDSGKFLRVSASGAPEWQLVANAEDNSY